MGGARLGTGWIVGVLAGLLAGWMLGNLSQPAARTTPPRALAATEGNAQSEAPGASPELSAPPRVPARDEPGEAAPTGASTPIDESLISEALRDYARDGILRGWSSTRAVPMPDAELAELMERFEGAVLGFPEIIGRGAAEDANMAGKPEEGVPKPGEPLEAFLAHDPIELLARIDEADGMKPWLELVNDAAGFAQLFPARTSRAIDAGEHFRDPDEALEDGSALDFPAGVFRLRLLMQKKDPFPRDVTLRGAGMDATLLLIKELSTRGELRNFTLRDCTVFTEGYLFDLREHPASMLFERVRAVGFDMGAGSSCLIAAPGLALLARSSRFEGGYGDCPWSGKLFDVRGDALLARFEGCWIDQLYDPVVSWTASVVFANCTLTNLLHPVVDLERPGVVYQGSSVAYFSGEPSQAPHKDLNDLFPDWEKRIQE